MDLGPLLKGLIIGLTVPIPMGPVGILCIRRALYFGTLYGLLTGLSAAISDMTYGVIATFGINFVSNLIYDYQQEIRIAGSFILLALGYRTFKTRSTIPGSSKQVLAPALAFFSTFLITFTNPMALFAYAAAFAGIGIKGISHNSQSAALFVAGIFAGSLSWYSLLTLVCRLFRKKISERGLAIMNKVAGTILALFALISLWSGLVRL